MTDQERIHLTELERTCGMCPAQWEGTDDQGRPVYIRYRHGWFSLQVGPEGGSIWDAVDCEPIIEQQLGGEYDGWLSDDALCAFVDLPEGWIAAKSWGHHD